jgi:hypothetical protein
MTNNHGRADLEVVIVDHNGEQLNSLEVVIIGCLVFNGGLLFEFGGEAQSLQN